VVRQPATFKGVPAAKRPKKTTTQISYAAEIELVERIRKYLRRPYMSNREVGQLTFEHYIKRECPK
jgi:hypothetical protein